MKAIGRLYQYFDFKGIKPTRLEKEMGLGNGYFSGQLRRDADIGSSIVDKIIENNQDLNIYWLITGKGDMLLDFTKGITGGENPATDEEFNSINTNLVLLDKLLLSNKRANVISLSYSDIYGNIMLLNEYLYLYDIHNKMFDVLECFQQKQIGMKDVMEEFKANFSVVEELYSIVEPYKTIIGELFDKVSDFNDKHDRLYSMDEEK